MRRLLPLLPLLLVACAPVGGDDGDDATTPAPCVYPADFAEPMELGRAIAPYAWPVARAFGGEERAVALERVFCNEDDIDWSPFDVLLFVSYPAW